ncbi:MAG: AAC(3) family N-acetyltransferase [Kiritimatiellae bacterium]|nr:AAC(3) family N-acetyltransferase [Kiritimatiellia bacterium]
MIKSMRVVSEPHFLAGEDVRGALVVLEPETELTGEHLLALDECGAAGFVSDYNPRRFEEPDRIPTLDYNRERFGHLVAIAVSPRRGVRLRTLANQDGPQLRVSITDDGTLELPSPPAKIVRTWTNAPSIGYADIAKALSDVGVRKGDTLLVHSSLSACGWIEGGAKTVIDALKDALGDSGNMFFPAFRRSECFLNGAPSKRWDRRPADEAVRGGASVKWIGEIPLEFIRRHPDAPYGRHISHPWTGWGPKAREVLSHQSACEPPFSDNSCPYKVMEMGGKVLHFGTSLGRTSFMHCIETHFRIPGASSTAYFQIRLPDGEIAYKPLDFSFAGSRESTTMDEKSRFYRKAVADGLGIAEVALGCGRVRMFDCRSFWEIASKILLEDPSINIGRAFS